MGHSEVECPHPVARDDEGKLPYDAHLRASDDRQWKGQSFGSAAAESFGSGSSSVVRPSRSHTKSGGNHPSMGVGSSYHSLTNTGKETGDPKVQSPLKQPETSPDRDSRHGKGTGKKLFNGTNDATGLQQRTRKSKVFNDTDLTPDLNIPLADSQALVLVGIVNSRVNQLDGPSKNDGDSMIEILKKQKRISTNQNARSAATANGSPRRAQ